MLLTVQAFSITDQESLILKSKIENTCIKNNVKCNYKVLDWKYINAFADRDNNVNFTTGILDKLNLDELTAIGYHEVGHIVLKHYQQDDKFLDKYWKYPQLITINRYHNEIQADLFSLQTSNKYNETNYLPQALLKITAPDKLYKNTKGHPSSASRIILLRKLGAQ